VLNRRSIVMAVAHGNARCAAMKEMQANLIAAKIEVPQMDLPPLDFGPPAKLK